MTDAPSAASGGPPPEGGAPDSVPAIDTPLTRHAGIRVPVVCGAMYPCSNPELVAAASAAGGIGIVQPVSLTYVHGWDFREGLRYIRSLTDRPIGMNALIEQGSKTYRRRMEAWLDIALEEGVRFFVTSLGKPRWVVERTAAGGGIVYHDVTERKWALKAVDSGVHGLIGVNALAGGHPGPRTPEALLDEVGDLGLPVVCAGGVATEEDFVRVLRLGYAGVQMGTRFIATPECSAPDAYKQAILEAGSDDIVHTERISGVPVAVIDTPYIRRMGLKAGWFARRMLRGRRTKHWMRTFYALRSFWQLRRALRDTTGSTEYWQAGRSVAGIRAIEPTGEIIGRFARAAARAGLGGGAPGSPG
ncbi:MAG: nitronate monooxygenase [Gemmatimonadetes bacterium]|nr:MAG: nitronate monooxygenase [Gemmatimonadota bacterium]